MVMNTKLEKVFEKASFNKLDIHEVNNSLKQPANLIFCHILYMTWRKKKTQSK